MTKSDLPTDEQLVQAYISGDNHAFDTLLERYRQKVFSQIYFHVRDTETANDLFQEVFMKVIIKLRDDRYTEVGKFSGWLTRLTNNMVMDHFRQQATVGGTPPLSTDNEEYDLLNRRELSVEAVEQAICNQQIKEDALRVMNALPESQRQIIEMRFFLDMSFKEIADATGVSINTALGRMRYAILNMRKIVRDNAIALDPA